jgi:FkbM family methyltransferase
VSRPRPSQLELIAYAENAEDVVLCRTFRNRSNGFYVDVGSGYPTEGSLTKNLIDRLQWSGIDIEPQWSLCERLRADRPRSKVVQCAIGTTKGQATFFRPDGNWALSTLDKKVARRHSESGWTLIEEQVEVRTLDEVLREDAKPEFDLLKVDVEGFERDVLLSIDLEYWLPQVVVVEATQPETTIQTNEDWEHLLLDVGYKLCLFDGLNRFYSSPKSGHLSEMLSIPANVFDRYIQYAWWERLSMDAQREIDPFGRFRHLES